MRRLFYMSKIEQRPNTSHKLFIYATTKSLVLERGGSLKEKRSKQLENNRSIKNKKRRSPENIFSSTHFSNEEFIETLTENLSNQLEDVTGILNVSGLFYRKQGLLHSILIKLIPLPKKT